MATRELSKAFEPQEAEKRLYDYWLAKKLFHAQDESEAPAFSIVIPPPNVTGMLHMGHRLNACCSACGNIFQVDKEWMGLQIECPQCGKNILVSNNMIVTI